MPTTADRDRTPGMRPPSYVEEGRARLRARNLALVSGARLHRAAARAGGDQGLGLACALTGMILGGTPPVGWPIAELIALLSRERPGRHRQVAPLLAALRRIEADIDLLMPEKVEDRGASAAPTRRAA